MTESSPASESIALHFAQLTHIGGRPSNQDAVGSAQQDDLGCFVVSDGAGGHEGGEVASNIVVKAILDSFLQALSFSARAMRSYVDQAILQVGSRQADEAALDNMSATVATILIDQKNRVALWAHLGDTRIYHFRDGKLQALTKDHSLVQQFIDAGYCKPDEARSHPQRSVLFAAIGAQGDTVPEITETMVELHEGDAFLMCSDGFWEWVTEDEMAQTLADATSAECWLADMNRLAGKKGNAAAESRDNYTALTIWLGERDNATPDQQEKLTGAGLSTQHAN